MGIKKAAVRTAAIRDNGVLSFCSIMVFHFLRGYAFTIKCQVVLGYAGLTCNAPPLYFLSKRKGPEGPALSDPFSST